MRGREWREEEEGGEERREKTRMPVVHFLCDNWCTHQLASWPGATQVQSVQEMTA